MLARTLLFLALAACGDLSPTMPVYDTIIVGMGAAGCTAASVLCKAGRRVLALEAQNRVGGRVNTVPFGEGVVELGAEWIHGECNSRVYDLAVQNNVTLLSQDVSFQVFRSDGTTTDSALVNELVNYALDLIDHPPKDPEPLGQYLTRRLMEYITANHPALLNDTDFIQQFLHFMDLVINNYEATNSWNDVSTYTRYQDLGGDLHMSWHRYGYKTLFEILLNTYKGGPGYPTLNIQFEKVVTRITYPQDPTKDVEVICKDGSFYKARNVIVTVSLGVLKERHKTLFFPVLPQSKTSAIANISMGTLGKIILLFPNRWLGNTAKDAFTFFWKGEDKKGLEGDWGTEIELASSPMGNRNAVTVWTYGNITKLVSIGRICHQTLFDPPLPTAKVDTINQVSIGYAGKIVLNFDQIWWDTSKASNEFFWTLEDKNKLPNEDRWMLGIQGVGLTMGLNTTVSLWTTGERTKLLAKDGRVPALRVAQRGHSAPHIGGVQGASAITPGLRSSSRREHSLAGDHDLQRKYTTLFYPPLPDEKAAIIDTISIGVVDKIVLLYDHAWWRKDLTVYGFIWTKEEKSKLPPEDEWVYTIFGASSPTGSEKALTLWTSGRMAKMVETLPEDVVKRKAMELIRRFMGKDRTIPEPTDMLRSTWYLNPYTRGSYSYDNLQTPLHPNAREILAEPLVDSSGTPRVLFAGEATDPTHFSTVHGATDSGHREATRLLPKGKL